MTRLQKSRAIRWLCTLSAIAALSRNRLLWALSILVALGGAAFFVDGFLLFF